MLNLISQIRKQKFRHIYYGGRTVPQIVESIAQETGAVLLKLSDGQNVRQEEIDGGITFVGLMEKNLEKLKTGMACP
jgi:ABC-type Zn uptake system ZnuABC Zn-binding protein ZnuA